MLKIDSLKLAVRAMILSAVFSTASAYAAPTIIDANNLDEILKLAKGFGHAVLETDGVGDPMIRGRIDGIKYGIFFYGCTDGTDCKDIQFQTGWDGVELSLETINRWNQEQRYGTASIDEEGDPRLEFPVNITFGVTSENLEDTIDWWAVTMRNFRDFVDENSAD